MIINLTELSADEKIFDFVSQPDLEDEAARLARPAKITGRLKKGIAQVDVAGEIKSQVEIDCARCLAPFTLDLQIPFQVAYVSAEHYTQAKEAEIRGADLEIAIYENEEVSLAELVREQILLNVPAQAFCKEDCQGLCQKCGANKNTQSCSCEEKETDPRWSALKSLKRNT